MAGIHFLLAHSKLEQLGQLAFDRFSRQDRLAVFGVLHAVNKTLLLDFFHVGVEEGSFMRRDLLRAAGLDPTIKEEAQKRLWDDPEVSGESMNLLGIKDDESGGGDVHMQPLVPFASSTGIGVGPLGKRVLFGGIELVVGGGNMLDVVVDDLSSCVYICNFADGKREPRRAGMSCEWPWHQCGPGILGSGGKCSLGCH